jgi:hypothetical protein
MILCHGRLENRLKVPDVMTQLAVGNTACHNHFMKFQALYCRRSRQRLFIYYRSPAYLDVNAILLKPGIVLMFRSPAPRQAQTEEPGRWRPVHQDNSNQTKITKQHRGLLITRAQGEIQRGCSSLRYLVFL